MRRIRLAVYIAAIAGVAVFVLIPELVLAAAGIRLPRPWGAWWCRRLDQVGAWSTTTKED